MADFEFDIFISHSSRDKLVARELTRRLESDGFRVWLDEREIQPGDVIGLKIEHGLESSRSLVFLMSSNALDSEWATLERQTAMFRDPTNVERRFIPVRIDDSPMKDTLRQFSYVDWRERSEEEYGRLLRVCRSATMGPPPDRDQRSGDIAPTDLFNRQSPPRSSRQILMLLTVLGMILAGSLWVVAWRARQPSTNMAITELVPKGSFVARSGEEDENVVRLPRKSGGFLLLLPVEGASSFTTYDFELRGLEGGKTWQFEDLVPDPSSGACSVQFPRAFLDEGFYSGYLFGLNASKKKRSLVSSYTIEVRHE